MSEEIYSPGLEGVIAGETAISTIVGGLQYRGYSIEDLADKSNFEETAYLLLYGKLPSAKELAAFQERVRSQAGVAPEILDFVRKIPRGVPTMDVLRSGASALAHWDADAQKMDHDANLRKAERLLAQLPVVLAARFRFLEGKEAVAPDAKYSLAANLVWMLSGESPSERSVKAMDVSLILYAEHEYNASTFAARVICSTLADLHSAVAGAIGALKGPLHGGANERVMEVLQEVGTAANAEKWIRDALARKQRIMGFGHRVYKDGDPRAAYLKPLCAALAKETGHDDMEQMADVIESIVRTEKKLPPNLDWPSARLYYYMGLPIDLYTPLFVVSRVAGWSAHVIEQLDNNRLIRPRARYTGALGQKYVPVEKR
jgi:citrate synthase